MSSAPGPSRGARLADVPHFEGLPGARHDRLYALSAVALAIGLRRGEALGLTVGRCGPGQWTGRYYEGALASEDKPGLRDVKTESSAASVPLPAELVAILRRHRRDQFGDAQVARANTLGQGLISPQPRKRPRSCYRRFQAAQPNECWQSDFTHWRLADGTEVEILNWPADHSRYLLTCTAYRRVAGPDVVASFTDTLPATDCPSPR